MVRYFIPCYRKSDNEPGMYDLVNNVFYTNAGSGTFFKGNETLITSSSMVINENNHTLYAKWQKNPIVTFDANGGSVNISNKEFIVNSTYCDLPTPTREGYTFLGWARITLPSEYQEVEYIESNGAQYISPGIQTDSSIYWYAKFSITHLKGDSSSGYNMIVGAYNRPQMAVATNQWTVGNAGSSIPFIPSEDTIYEATMNKNGSGSLIINEEDTGLKRTGTCTPTIFNPSSIYGGTYARVYSVKYVDRNSNNNTANFVPCYRKSDNVIGLYNTVSNKFYTNHGSGTFIKGSDRDSYTVMVSSSTEVTYTEDHTLYAIW